jgi:hypothetical protein
MIALILAFAAALTTSSKGKKASEAKTTAPLPRCNAS